MPNGAWNGLRAMGVAGITLLAMASASAQTPVPVFPGAVGFGATTTTAGRNGVIRRVNTLADTGTGSLRAALSAPCPNALVVIFDVSGIIHLQDHVQVSCPNTTVAGQTAPAPGIMLEGGDLLVFANNVLIQHIHSRVGKEHPDDPKLDYRSGIAVDAQQTSVSNVVIDHVSVAWAPDQTFYTWSSDKEPPGMIRNVTLSNSLLAEGLRFSCPLGTGDDDPEWEYCHPDYIRNYDPATGTVPPSEQDGHSTGPLIGEHSENISVIRNISAFNRARNPMISDTATNVQVANIFNYWGRFDAHTQIITKEGPAWTITASVRGNTYIHEPTTSPTRRKAITVRTDVTDPQGDTGVDLFVADNRLLYDHDPPLWAPAANESQWDLVSISGPSPVTQLPAEPAAIANLQVPLLSADRVEMVLTSSAGARSAYRDSVDLRIIEDIEHRVANRGYGTDGGYVSDPGEAGGYPDWQPYQRPTPIAAPLETANSDNDPYTDVEEWLHKLAWQLEGDPRNAKFDTFEDGDHADPNVDDGKWTGWFPDSDETTWSVVTDGTTKVLNQSALAGGTHLYLAKTWFYDQVIQAKVKPTAFESSGRFVRVAARYRDPANSYYVTLRSPNVVEIKKIVGNTSELIQAGQLPINPNHWYAVRFSLGSEPGTSGATVLSATVTNLTTSETVTLGDTDTDPLPPGFVAVGTFHATARFDDVFVSPTGTTAVPHLTEDFDDGDSAGWTDTTGGWSVVSSGGSNVRRQNDTTAGVLARSVWNTTIPGTDQSVQATVKPLVFSPSSSFISVHARYVDAVNNYNVTLRNNGKFELKKVINGSTAHQWVREVTLPSTFKLTNPHTLRIDVTGPATAPVLRGYLDGVELLTLTDDSGNPFDEAGKAAIGTYGASAEFDNVIVTTPP